MNVTDPTRAAAGLPARPDAKPTTADEAARQFEQVFVKHFVQTMTKGLFDQSLAGDDAPGSMDGYKDMQAEALTDSLTNHLIDSGALRLRETLLRQWGQAAETPPPPADAPADAALPLTPSGAEGLPRGRDVDPFDLA